jgi:hypothetical protein|nr:MAG: hypothetical protein [Lake Baikal virophage 2]
MTMTDEELVITYEVCAQYIKEDTDILEKATQRRLQLLGCSCGCEWHDKEMKRAEFWIKSSTAAIRQTQLEKMIFKTIHQEKKSPLLLKKFTEMMSSVMELYEKGVRDDLIEEECYLRISSQSVQYFNLFNKNLI